MKDPSITGIYLGQVIKKMKKKHYIRIKSFFIVPKKSKIDLIPIFSPLFSKIAEDINEHQAFQIWSVRDDK